MRGGKAIIFSAPSGAGKTTIVKHLASRFPQLQFSVSATTRAPRPTETADKDYYFLNTDQFNRHLESGDFLEWEEVYTGIRYGTLKSEIERLWKAGHHVLFDVDVQGGINLKKYLGEKALAVFVEVNNLEELRKRLENRNTETPEKIATRVAKAQEEMKFKKHFDKVLVNDSLPETLMLAEKLVENFLSK